MDLKHRSKGITDGRDQAPARAMFKAIGFTDSDLAKPIIGVANTWIEIGPCNYHLRELAGHVKAGVREAGGTVTLYEGAVALERDAYDFAGADFEIDG